MHELRAVRQFSVGAAVSDLKNRPHRGGSTFMFAAVKLEDEVSNRREIWARYVTARCMLVSYFVMGLTLASTTDRPLQHFILSGNSWIPVRERHREGRGHVVVYVTRSFEFFCRKTFTDCNSNRLSWAGEFENFSFCFLVLFGSSVSQKGSLPFLLMSSSLRLTKLAMVVGRLDRSLSGMLSFFKAWQLKSCYGNTRGGGGTMQYYSLSAEIKQTFSGKVQKDREHKVSWRHAPLNVVEKQCHLSSAFIWIMQN